MTKMETTYTVCVYCGFRIFTVNKQRRSLGGGAGEQVPPSSMLCENFVLCSVSVRLSQGTNCEKAKTLSVFSRARAKNCQFIKLFILNNLWGTLSNFPHAALHFATKGDPWYLPWSLPQVLVTERP